MLRCAVCRSHFVIVLPSSHNTNLYPLKYFKSNENLWPFKRLKRRTKKKKIVFISHDESVKCKKRRIEFLTLQVLRSLGVWPYKIEHIMQQEALMRIEHTCVCCELDFWRSNMQAILLIGRNSLHRERASVYFTLKM